MAETNQTGNIGLGDTLTLSALQLTYLCDRAIERYLDMLQEYQDKTENGFVLMDTPDTLEAARDEVVALFEEQKKKDQEKEQENG